MKQKCNQPNVGDDPSATGHGVQERTAEINVRRTIEAPYEYYELSSVDSALEEIP